MAHINRSKVSGEIAGHAFFHILSQAISISCSWHLVELLLDDGLQVLDRIEVRRVPRPLVFHPKGVDIRLEPSLSHDSMMSQSSVLHKNCFRHLQHEFLLQVRARGMRTTNCWQKRLLEDLRHVILGSHSCFSDTICSSVSAQDDIAPQTIIFVGNLIVGEGSTSSLFLAQTQSF